MSKSQKKTESIEAKFVDNKPAKRWNAGTMFWGLLFVLIGTLLLLDNLNIIETHFAQLWQLWPIFIIGTGISMLSLHGWLGGIVSFVLTFALLGLITVSVIDTPFYTSLQRSQVKELTQTDSAQGARELDLRIQTGAAEVAITSSSRENGVTATQEATQPNLVKSTKTDGDMRRITFSTDASKTPWHTNTSNKLQFDLTRKLPVALAIDAGASSLKGDLSQVKLTSFTVKTGASDVDIRLGERQTRQRVTLSTGVSSVTLRIPKQVGIRVESNGALTHTQFEGVAKQSDNLYQSVDFDAASTQITIQANLGVSDFKIIRY